MPVRLYVHRCRVAARAGTRALVGAVRRTAPARHTGGGAHLLVVHKRRRWVPVFIVQVTQRELGFEDVERVACM